jgi:hypothetical protein
MELNKIKQSRNKSQFNKKRNPKLVAAKRKKELKKDKITLACQLLFDAVKKQVHI